jgi:hypothetical protein
MAYLVAALAGLLFGAGVQYLGTLTMGAVLGTWAWAVSGMSAPWLLLPFVAGMTQTRARRAMMVGLVVTLAALAGYFVMAQSPMEGAPIGRFVPRMVAMIGSGYNPLWIAGGLVSGPLFGLLGQRWRVARSWVSAAVVAFALCFEPLARGLVGMLDHHPVVWGAEIAIGIVLAGSFAFLIANSRRTGDAGPALSTN